MVISAVHLHNCTAKVTELDNILGIYLFKNGMILYGMYKIIPLKDINIQG